MVRSCRVSIKMKSIIEHPPGGLALVPRHDPSLLLLLQN
jgi:hypothetical protein